MQTTSPGTLVQHAIEGPVAMETDDDGAPAVLYNRQEEMDTIVNERYMYNTGISLKESYFFLFKCNFLF